METQLITLIILVLSVYYYITYYSPKHKTHEGFCFLGVGDCGTKQISVSDTINKVLTENVSNTAKSCAASTGQNQLLALKGLSAGGDISIDGVSQTGDVKMDFSCLQSTKNNFSSNTALKNDLDKKLKQMTAGYQFQPSEQEEVTKLINDVTNKTTTNSVSNCIANTFNNQTLLIESLSTKGNISIKNISQEATSTVVAKCVQDDKTTVSAVNNLENKLKVQQEQEAKGVDIFASFASFGAWATAVTAIVFSLPITSSFCSISSSIVLTMMNSGGDSVSSR